MVDFSQLKKSSGKAALEKLTQELKAVTGNQESGSDERFWYPNVDKAGNGYAVIRFLPQPVNEDVAFVRLWEHAFKGPTGKWYFEKSLTTIGKNDPVAELNSVLWNASSDDASPGRKQAREQKRKLGYIANVYVVQDQQNPENNGKVFLFKFGKKIMDKINEAMVPQFADEAPLNPFDLWAGANFKLKIRNVEGYRNYDKSEFASPSALFEDDDEIEAVWKKEHSLKSFIDPTTFKSYDELKTKLNSVLGLDGSPVASRMQAAVAQKRVQEDLDDEIPWHEPKAQKSAPAPQTQSLEDEDEDLNFFRGLANK